MSWVLSLTWGSAVPITSFFMAVLVWHVLHSRKARRPYPETTRCALFLLVAVLSSVELYHVWTGRLNEWMVWIILISNVWGFLDAVLRFPIVHDVDTFFVLKQCSLVTLKVLCVSFGFEKSVDYDEAKWLLVIVAANAFFPMLHSLALPYNDNFLDRRLAAHDVVDVDLAVRILEFAINSQQRDEGYGSLKKRIRTSALHLADHSPVAEKAINYSFRLPSSPLVKSARRSRCV